VSQADPIFFIRKEENTQLEGIAPGLQALVFRVGSHCRRSCDTDQRRADWSRTVFRFLRICSVLLQQEGL